MADDLGQCVGCGQPGRHSIMLAVGSQGDSNVKTDRYYLPNQSVRRLEGEGYPRVTKEIPFCATCMRTIEYNMRATILSLQADHELLTIIPKPSK